MVSSRPGHVFVVKADITALECDAWLCPTDDWFDITVGFGWSVGKPEGGILAGYRWHAAESAQLFAPPEGGRPRLRPEPGGWCSLLGPA